MKNPLRHPVLFLFFVTGVSPLLRAQTYTVDGEDAYVRPVYLVMQNPGSDYVNARGHFVNALNRAGLQLITYDEMSRLMREEDHQVSVAEWLRVAGSRVEEGALKSAVSALGVNGFAAQKILGSLVSEGLVELTVEQEELKFRTNTVKYYSWADAEVILERTLERPNTFHFLSYSYTYRESVSCGSTFTEIHGSINEISNGQNTPLVHFDFRQPYLSSRCPREVIPRLVQKMIPVGAASAAEVEAAAPSATLDYQWKGDTLQMKAINTVLLVPKPGEDCNGIDGAGLSDQFALGLLSAYDIIDRSALEMILDEQAFAMQGLVRDADWIEAGELAGAEGILTMQCLCLGGQNTLKAKLISVTSSVVLWSAILSNYEGTPEVKSITKAVVATLDDL